MQVTNKDKQFYNRHLELSLVIVLCCMIFVFQGWKYFDSETTPPPMPEIPVIDAIDVPRTIQDKPTPPPERPAMPEATEELDVPENITISENTGFNFTKMPKPPMPPDVANEPVPFISVDVKPQPIGGYAAFAKHLEYPDLARRAGVEGTVFVRCLLDEQGNVIQAEIAKSLGNNGCDQAALAAAYAVKWTPAMQRDKAVRVWVSIPIRFKLR